MNGRPDADVSVFGETGPQNVPIESNQRVCRPGAVHDGRVTFEVGERKFLPVSLLPAS